MNRRQIERYLHILATELAVPARAFLTGAAAAALWGRVRPSADIDLGLELRAKGKSKLGASSWQVIQQAVERTTRLTGVPASVAEDIDRWGMITLLDYKRTSRLFRRFGKLEVRLLDPVNWSIGKLTRCLDPDIRDVAEVFRRQSVSPIRAAGIWGRALRASPASTSQFQFRLHVQDFFKKRGRAVWGPTFNPDAAIRRFHAAAGIVAGA
ncbi:MAG: hypothetical protein H7X95_06515 [Deltaproteobacteria bacterium]|nr:hypothetical protein [Deltaproteobacteria bacterium]